VQAPACGLFQVCLAAVALIADQGDLGVVAGHGAAARREPGLHRRNALLSGTLPGLLLSFGPMALDSAFQTEALEVQASHTPGWLRKGSMYT